MKPVRTTITTALRQKAKGERNSVGDVWGDHICNDAADLIDDLAEALASIMVREIDGDWYVTADGPDGFWSVEIKDADALTAFKGWSGRARSALRRAKGEA